MPINITTGSAATKSYKSSGGGGLYPFTTVTFSVTGNGQYSTATTSTAQSYMTGGELGGWMYNSSFFYVSGGYYYWAVPKTGDYRMVTQGPRGYSPQGYGGSSGTYMSGNFSLVSGQWLKMIVGQFGGSSYGGGSGMTAIATDSNSPLLVSGGGVCGSPWGSSYTDASTGTSGNSGSQGGGSGGYGAYGNGGYGGAGFYGNGSGYNPGGATAPYSFVSGVGYGGNTCNGAGGFGGGAGTDGCYFGSNAGAGGYSGGGGGNPGGGGGGSYNAGTSQSNYVSYGSGYISITKL